MTDAEELKLWRKFCALLEEGRASVVFYGRVDSVNTGIEVNDVGDFIDELMTDPNTTPRICILAPERRGDVS